MAKTKNKPAAARSAVEPTERSAGVFRGFTRANGIEWIRSFAIAIFLALLIRWPVAEPFKIPSGSMIPTLDIGDRIFVNKHAYGVRFPFNGFRIFFTTHTIWYTDKWLWNNDGPDRWDIVVFKAVEENVVHDTLVKRVVGLPGEQVLIRGGRILVNGEPVELPPDMPPVEYTTPSPHLAYEKAPYGVIPEERFTRIPEGHYFLLGDNSASSRDGRFWGFVPKHHLLGEVTSIWWPISRWRDFTGFTDTLWWNGLVTLALGWLAWRLFIGRSWIAYFNNLPGVIAPGEHVHINRARFGLPLPFTRMRVTPGIAPKRGDIVAYYPPSRPAELPELLLGRIAGLAGERVYLQDGRLLIDGNPVNAPGLADRTFSSGDATEVFGRSKGKDESLVPHGHVYILQDEPNEGLDSRVLGWIPISSLIGTTSFVWWPPTRARRIRP